MALTPKIVITKTLTFRGATGHEWSNIYHFAGGEPSSEADWTTFADDVVAAEALALTGGTSIVQAEGFSAAGGPSVFNKTYSTPGALAPSGGVVNTPSECVALVRYDTDQRTSKNHPIYLFNYYHRVCIDATVGPDDLWTAERTALITYAGKWQTGFTVGGSTLKRAGPNGAVAQGHTVSQYVHIRDFPN